METVSERKAELLQAAAALFGRQGYHGTTVRDVARELDLQGGSLYAHIKTKEDLLWAIIDDVAAKFQRAADLVPAGVGPRDRLAGLIEAHLTTVAEELPFATVFFSEWACLGGERLAAISARRDKYEALFRRTIEQGAKQGVFKVESPKLAAIYVLSVLNWSHQWFKPGASLSIADVARQFTALTLRALGARAPAAR